MEFQDVVNELKLYMSDLYQSHAGISIGLYSYLLPRMYTGTATELSPTFDSIVSEIQAGRPCLLGFDSTSDYGAHMTACCGYYVTSYTNYAVVVDGQRTTHVYKVWTEHNDFVASIQIANWWERGS